LYEKCCGLPGIARQGKHTKGASVTSDTLRKFNRDTRWLAAGVLALVTVAALLLASSDQRPQSEEGQLTERVRRPERNLYVNANPTPRPSQAAVGTDSSNAQTTPVWTGNADYAFAATPLNEISPPEAVVNLNSPPIVNIPPIVRLNTQANAAIPLRSQNSAPIPRQKTYPAKRALAGVRRTIDVKARLIALWHQSLKRDAKARNWTAYSNLSAGGKKKAAYTAETNR
jgi:hypothetical protein